MIKDRWIFLPVLIMLSHFIFRLLDFSKIAYRFPLEKTNDIASYIAQLSFLVNYGFHQFVPNWGGGFVLFQTYPPGWFYFALPLYNLFNDYLIATFVSLVLMLIAILITIFYFGKLNKLSFWRKLAFFVFLFGNPIAIGNFLRLGRITELFGWVNFIILAFLFLWYVEKKFDLKFYFIFVIFYSILMLSHPAIIVIFPILLVGLFLSRNVWRDRIGLIFSSLFVYLVTAFWWMGFILNTDSGSSVVTRELLLFGRTWLFTNLASFIIPLVLWFGFYFYWREYKRKRELLFFLPIFVVSFLFFSRTIVFVPILNKVFPDVYLIMFLFFALYYFLKTKKFSKFDNFVKFGLLILAIVSVLISVQHTPFVREYTTVEYETVDLMEKVDGKLFLFGFPGSGFTDNGEWLPGTNLDVYALYSYSAACCNLNSAVHVIFSGTSAVEERRFFFETMRLGSEGQCVEFKRNLDSLEVEEFITFESNCDVMLSCGFKLKDKSENVCLYENLEKI